MTSIIEELESFERSEKSDIGWSMGNIMEELIDYVQVQSIDYTRDEMIEINSVSDEELMNMIKIDKEIFDLIIEPSSTVKAFYSFTYKL